MDDRKNRIRARLAQVEANPDHPHRAAVLRSLRRMLGEEAHTDAQFERFEAAISSPGRPQDA